MGEQDTILEDLELPPSNLEILSECQELNRGMDLLTNEDPFSLASEATVSMSGASGSSTPAMQTVETSSTYSMSPPPSLLQPIRLHKQRNWNNSNNFPEHYFKRTFTVQR